MKRKQLTAVLGGLATLAMLLPASSPAQAASSPTPAAPPSLSGLERVDQDSEGNGGLIEGASARCTGGRVVVGGGATVSGFGSSQMRIKTMMPVFDEDDGSSYYVVSAEAPYGASPINAWKVTAYAVCAYRPAGYTIERDQSTYGVGTFKQTTAQCTGGRRTLGSGASASAPTGRAAVQLSRTDGALGISRATARVDRAGFTGNWLVYSWAICADPIGAEVSYGGGTQTATATCDGTDRVHGVGGGGGLTDLGPVYLRVVEPSAGLTSVTAAMTGPYPGGMVAQAICA